MGKEGGTFYIAIFMPVVVKCFYGEKICYDYGLFSEKGSIRFSVRRNAIGRFDMRRILVVDDEEMMRMIARRILSKDYEVLLASSGPEAIEVYEKEQPDLILSDLLMPDMNGFEMHQILQEKYGKDVRIMYMTADDAEDVEDKGFDLGASDFIRKPFRPESLLRRVENIMENLEQISSLTEEATIDRLTGLLNKDSSAKVLAAACQKESGTLFMVDLDSFKLVNDLYGHDMGDRVLKGFATILVSNTEVKDIRCRVGGDEFAMFVKGMKDEAVLREMAARVNRQIVAMAKELMGEDMEIPLGASFGGVMVPEQGRDYDKLIQKADRALYIVKKNGKHGIGFHRDELAKKADEAVASLEELHRICQVLEERNVKNSALWLDKDSFGIAYRFMIRFIQSYHSSVYRVLVTLEKKDPAMGDELFRRITDEFGNVIDRSLRKSDFMMQNRMNQFLVILPELQDEFAESVFARVRNAWKESGYHDKTVIRFDAEKVSGDTGNIEEKRRIRL